MSAYFLDTNIVMYAVGGEHPYKGPCAEILLRAGRGEVELDTDVEVVQEILYRYARLGRRTEGLQVASKLMEAVRTVLPVTDADIRMAIALMEEHQRLSPRDAIHAAVMLNNRLSEILSVDPDFDGIKEVRRVDPTTV